MRSLRVRLFVVAALSIAVALATVAMLTRQVVRMEFHRLEVTERVANMEGAAMALAERLARAEDSVRLARKGKPSRLDRILEELGRSAGRRLLLIGPGGKVLGASSAGLRAAHVELGPGGRVSIDWEAPGGQAEQRRIVLANVPHAPVTRSDGSVAGWLALLPPGDREAASLGPPFGGAFDLRLSLAALAAGLVALGLSWALSRRILGPIEALTRAARRLGSGDLAARVPARGADEIGELSRAFNAMAEDLSRQESLRRTLVTDVAHELRTPLTNLRGQLEAVEDGLLPSSPDTIRSLQEEVMLLSRLVEDLQTLSVAEARRLPLDRAAVQLRDLVEGALESMKLRAKESGITLRSRLEELPPVNADAARIGQVLRNLLTNAITHTPAGGSVEVGARAEPGFVTVSVIDTGPGIAAEHLPHVFERFYRADPSRARATGGAGLGLAIVKSIVEAHGGSVGVESHPGNGAIFRFSLPLAE